MKFRKASPNQISVGDIFKIASACVVMGKNAATITPDDVRDLALVADLSEWKVRKALAESWGREEFLR